MVLVLGMSLIWTAVADAQIRMRAPANATRAQLETMAARCASDAADPKRSASDRLESSDIEKELRDRLTTGDFRVGDRIIVRVSGGATAFDTLSVTAAQSIRVADAGEVPLAGVLRSELEAALNAQLARYFRSAVVHAQPLVRLAVLGEVRTPGFFHVPTQSLLSDVISAAGGPTATGRLDRASVRREGATLVAPGEFAKGLASGATLDELGIRAGDEIVVSANRPLNWSQVLQTAAVVMGSAATFIALRHR